MFEMASSPYFMSYYLLLLFVIVIILLASLIAAGFAILVLSQGRASASSVSMPYWSWSTIAPAMSPPKLTDELLGKIEGFIIEQTGDGEFAAYVVEWLDAGGRQSPESL